MKLIRSFSTAVVTVVLAGCAIASDVQELQDGSYRISAHAAPVRGGATGAQDVAYRDAQKFCATKMLRAIIINSNERDVYQGSFGFGSGGGGGGVFASGNVDMHFKCS